MRNYIGIDLGTTNSAICSYDGQNVRIWKSPDQNDVTPSAIFIDKRGNRYYGQRAYDSASRDPERSMTLFKRYMGTSTVLEIKGTDISMRPEEASAEILRVLYGYLPEEIRNDNETAVVITVPAAFNQMKKDATLEAARLAGFNKVSLMQEPVAAVMSVMRESKTEGIFLIYDLGGGTFDISIAENIGGNVSLLAHGGLEMCGGRDWDRMIVNTYVIPWLRNHFDLPDDLLVNPKYKTLISLAHWAAEKAKIELSSRTETVISLDESSIRKEDESGEEIYIDIPLSRNSVNGLIPDQIKETINVTRETMKKAGLSANDVERIVFVGGPTNYAPLREYVCEELALKADLNVNPMTAVSEGASIFAESIDWNTVSHNRKEKNSKVGSAVNITMNYTARTADNSAMIAFVVTGSSPYTVEIISKDTGWSSGRGTVTDKKVFKVPLNRQGENRFSVKVYDEYGRQISLDENEIVITKTIATIAAIPASHSISIEVLNALGGAHVLSYLVREGESLPKKGKVLLKAGETIHANSSASFNLKLWEGEIEQPIDDNNFIGVFKIKGSDFDSGIITTGADIECEYEISDSGTLKLEVSIPSIGITLSGHNFYSRQEGEAETLNAEKIAEDGESLIDRIDDMDEKVSDPRLDEAREKAQRAAEITEGYKTQEDIQSASTDLLEAKKALYNVRKDNLTELRQAELDECIESFNNSVRKYAKNSEIDSFEKQAAAAQRAIDRKEVGFENILSELNGKCIDILWRQDWFIIDIYHDCASSPYRYIDINEFYNLKRLGDEALRKNDIDTLRSVVVKLVRIRIGNVSIEDMYSKTNIIRG